MRQATRWTIVVVALLVSACSTDVDTTVRPFSEVQDSEFSFEADPNHPGRGIFRVTTTEPMICAIVWGEDDEFGNLNNSLDMAGTGIVQHDVFLPGAEPGTEYSYVVQGTTADGTLYRSPVSTFILPEPESTATTQEGRPNVAEGAEIVDVSSEFNDAFAAHHAVDGDLSTEWSSDGDGDAASITIRVERGTEVEAADFLTRSMTDGSAVAETFTLTVDDKETLGPFPAGNPADPQTADISVTGQSFRFDVETSTGGNTGAVEVRLFAPG